MTKDCYVYMIEEVSDEAPIKIGVAKEPLSRLSALQIGNIRNLELKCEIGPLSRKDAFITESRIHRELSEHRVVGEWFTSKARIPFILAAARG